METTAKPEFGQRADGRFQPGNQAAKGAGAPRGFANGRTKHGMSCKALSIGALPSGSAWVRKSLQGLRSALEAAVMDAYGTMSLSQQLLVGSALRHEMVAALAQRYLRINSEKMSSTERLSYLQAIASQSDLRDRCVDRLKLDRDTTQTIIQQLYGAQGRPDPIEVQQDQQDAAVSVPRAPEGNA